MTAKAKKTDTPTTTAAPKGNASAAPATADILAEIQRLAGDRDLLDCSSSIAKKLNKAKKLACPTGGRSHPARPSFTYWTGADVEAFAAKHSG